MKYLVALTLLALLILSACAFHPVMSEADFAAMQTATAAVPPIPTIEPQVAPPTATVELVPTVTSTPCRTIAGNINAQGKKLWHDESSPQWSQIVIDESKGERWFCSPEEAEAAGWVKANN